MIKTEKKGLQLSAYIWTDQVEESAWKQINNLTIFPYAFHHIAIMPDVHSGYGMPIGGVLAAKNVVIPNAVGVDIGCGMNYTQLDIESSAIIKENIKLIMGKIRESIPVGFKHNEHGCNDKDMPNMEKDIIIEKEFNSAKNQLGSLGGGNHFIEIQENLKGNIGIMIHSGSRNLGLQVAKHYNNIAKEKSKLPKDWELDFLDINDKDGQDYLKAMNYCLEFALLNRKKMMDKIKNIILDIYNKNKTSTGQNIKFDNNIDCHHNYAVLETHFGEQVMVHRKGAISAKKGELGIIPGSQGTASYIVEGLGNEDSFMSSSHGSGRLMSRSQARKELNLENEKLSLDKQGIIHSIRNEKDLDEAPSAYKNIDMVLSNETDLIKPIIKLRPLAIIKG
jgi:tRNA-splicing ligase RtcB